MSAANEGVEPSNNANPASPSSNPDARRGNLGLSTRFTFNISGAMPRIIGIVVNNVAHGSPPAPPQPANAEHSEATAASTASANNNNNNNGPQNQLLSVRARLFRVIFMKVAMLYAIAVSPKIQKLIEWGILVLAFLSLFILAYLHVAFIRTPINCLENVQADWPKDGILRVEIVSDPEALAANRQMRGKIPVNIVDYMISDDDGDSADDLLAISGNSTAGPALGELAEDTQTSSENGYPTPLKEKLSHLEMFARAGEQTSQRRIAQLAIRCLALCNI